MLLLLALESKTEKPKVLCDLVIKKCPGVKRKDLPARRWRNGKDQQVFSRKYGKQLLREKSCKEAHTEVAFQESILPVKPIQSGRK